MKLMMMKTYSLLCVAMLFYGQGLQLPLPPPSRQSEFAPSFDDVWGLTHLVECGISIAEVRDRRPGFPTVVSQIVWK